MLLISSDALVVANLSVPPPNGCFLAFVFRTSKSDLAEIHRLATDTQLVDKTWRAALHFKLTGIKAWPLYSGASR